MAHQLSKPEVICTHESDLDGFVSGLLLRRLASHLFGETPSLQAHNTQYWKQRPMTERSAWICDFTFESRLDLPNWLIVDHHRTEDTPRQATLIHDLNKSAGTLAYELCKENGLESTGLDRLVHLNNVADLFLENDPEFDLANDYANLIKTYQFWNLHALIDGDLERLIDHPLLEVMETKRRVEDPLGFAWSKRNLVQIRPDIGFVPIVIGNVNRIVHRLLEDAAAPYSVLLTVMRRPNSGIIVSLRSRNGEAINVARQLKGGGHANACGATLPRSIQQPHDAIDYLRATLNPAPAAPEFGSLENAFAELDKSRDK